MSSFPMWLCQQHGHRLSWGQERVRVGGGENLSTAFISHTSLGFPLSNFSLTDTSQTHTHIHELSPMSNDRFLFQTKLSLPSLVHSLPNPFFSRLSTLPTHRYDNRKLRGKPTALPPREKRQVLLCIFFFFPLGTNQKTPA